MQNRVYKNKSLNDLLLRCFNYLGTKPLLENWLVCELRVRGRDIQGCTWEVVARAVGDLKGRRVRPLGGTARWNARAQRNWRSRKSLLKSVSPATEIIRSTVDRFVHGLVLARRPDRLSDVSPPSLRDYIAAGEVVFSDQKTKKCSSVC